MGVNVIDLVRADGIEPRLAGGTKGGEYHSECPGCGDSGHDPKSGPPNRFHVWPEQNGGGGSFWCRRCQRAGDNIEYLMAFHGMDFPRAAEAIGRELERGWRPGSRPKHQKLPWNPPDLEEGGAVDVDLYRKKLWKFTNWAHRILINTPAQMAYLKRRGIGPDTIKRFRIGYNPGENGKKACFRPRGAWGLPEKKADGKNKRLWLPRGIVVPCIVAGQVVRIRIRRPVEDLTDEFSQTYYVIPGARMDRFLAPRREGFSIFALQKEMGGQQKEAWVVVETELDGMMIWQAAGDLVGVMAMGTSHAKPDPACHQLLKDAICILNALDFDQAGAGGWQWWEEQYPTAERWPVPKGKDPGEAFEQKVDIRAWILAGLPPIFRVAADTAEHKKTENKERRQEETRTPEKKTETPAGVLELAEILKQSPVQIENTPSRLRIIEPPAWADKNDPISRRISMLVFQDPEVSEYLNRKKPGVLNGANLIERGPG